MYSSEQANSLFTSILHSEVTPPKARPSSPERTNTNATASTSTLPTTPSRKRLFNFNSPSGSNPVTPTRRLDTPNDESYSLSPVRAESKRLLESPRRQLRHISKTPYRVLDAPDLADDFYLNLVDWSSTNVLGVGLGSCVYLWTAHTAAVSKLCDLEKTDNISSISWVQKVSRINHKIKCRNLRIRYLLRAQHSPLVPFRVAYTFMTQTRYSYNDLTTKHTDRG